MFERVWGFLSRRGWAGVQEIFLLVGLGVAMGMIFLYFFLVYKKVERPRRISITVNVIMIILLLAVMYFIWRPQDFDYLHNLIFS
jgi:uncharacterized membrane protein